MIDAPWFKFFPRRWMSSLRVRSMTLEQKGAFLELLCCAWIEGGIPDDAEQVGRLLGVDPKRLAGDLKRVIDAFPRGDDGRGHNAFQESIRTDVEAAQAARVEGGKARWRASRELSSSSARAEHKLSTPPAQAEHVLRASSSSSSSSGSDPVSSSLSEKSSAPAREARPDPALSSGIDWEARARERAERESGTAVAPRPKLMELLKGSA